MRNLHSPTSFIRLLLLGWLASRCIGDEDSYGTEVSWPMQHPANSLLRIESAYDSFMKDCAKHYAADLCEQNDRDRIRLNAKQPSLQMNFTNTGYAVVSAPQEAREILETFWRTHGKDFSSQKEYWEHGSIYTNHWESPTYQVEFSDGKDRQIVTEQVQSVLETWSKTPLVPTSIYGVRVYTNGSILSPHIDRVPLVISAIINIAQDVQEDWALEVIGHQGKAVNLTLQPGEMVLYESHSVLHGRPYPLKGKYYANIFLHFEPIGYTQELQRRLESAGYVKPNQQLYEEAQASIAVSSSTNRPHKIKGRFHLPYYIEDGTEEAARWRQEFIYRRKALPAKPKIPVFRPHHESPHHLAAKGHLDRLKALASAEPGVLDEADSNGWKPIHEAARAGRYKVLKYLIEELKVDVNERTNQGTGGSPLWWAEKAESGDPEVAKLLKKHGAKAIAPE